MGRIGAELAKLIIGECLAADAEQQNRSADPVLDAQRGNRIEGREHHRQRERNADQSLLLQQKKHLARRVAAPIADQLGVTRIVGDAGTSLRDMKTEPR